MVATVTEAVCAVWDDERDTAFFRIVADAFSQTFTLGATVLLASYDDECGAQGDAIDDHDAGCRFRAATGRIPTANVMIV